MSPLMRAIALLLAFASAALAQTPPCVKVVRPVRDYAHCGSGTVVSAAADHSLILTCWHVAPTADAALEVVTDGGKYPAVRVRADDRMDLALLRISAPLPPAIVADAAPAVGTTLHQWGCPGGGPSVLKWGPLRSEIAYYGSWVPALWLYPVWRVGLTPAGGDSGAGLFNPDGHLVAVAFAADIRRDAAGKVHTVAPESVVPLADVRRFLRGE